MTHDQNSPPISCHKRCELYWAEWRDAKLMATHEQTRSDHLRSLYLSRNEILPIKIDQSEACQHFVSALTYARIRMLVRTSTFVSDAKTALTPLICAAVTSWQKYILFRSVEGLAFSYIMYIIFSHWCNSIYSRPDAVVESTENMTHIFLYWFHLTG